VAQYSHTDFAAAYAQGDKRSKFWRVVSPSTAHQRDYTIGQIKVGQLAYVAGVVLIYAAQRAQGADFSQLHVWLGESSANLLLRMVLFAIYVRATPNKVAASAALRMIPMFNLTVAAAHWAWTALLFVDPTWSFGTFSTLLVFLLLTLLALTYAPASPLPAIMLLSAMWLPTMVLLWPTQASGLGSFGVLFAGALCVFSMGLYLTQRPMRRYLEKADEVDRLVQQLRASNLQLDLLRTEATAQLQDRLQFFAGASHDFGQRLHALKLLTHTAQSKDVSQRVLSLDALSRAVLDLESYVRDVLEFARIESRIVKPSYGSLHLQDVLQRLAVQFEAVADSRGIALRVRTTNAVAVTDEGVLRRVLENIVGNAIKFTRRGVLVAVRRRGGSWCIEVWDQGPGISPASMNDIFSSFYQERVYAEREQIGVGLGLAIVKRLADGLKYKIEVHSRLGRGTVFKVLLPAQPE
jgi:signal transduction histidine kinase